MPAVTVETLVKRFGATTAVDGMSWSAHPGEILAILGPNGAGKTTALSCVLGLLRPDEGTVRVLGSDPWGADAAHRARVGVMLQDGGLPNTVGAERLLRHLARFYADPEPVDALMRRLGVDAFAGTTVRRLSGGQRQRLALAVALVGRPEVALLDEPSSGLDPHARLDVWDLVADLRRRGTCVVLTTHSFEEAQRLADRVVIVTAGQVVADGPLPQVAGESGLESTYFSLTRSRTQEIP